MKAESATDATKSEGKEKLRKGLTNAFIVLDEDVAEGSGKVHIYTYKTKASDMDALGTIESMFRDAVVSERCRVQQIPADTLEKIRNVAIETIDVGQSDSQQQVQDESYMGVKMLVPFFFMYLIFMGMMSSGQQMLSSVIEEKNSRVIEVLLSAVSPFQLMTGKILGLATIGLTVVSVWAGLAYLAVWYTGVSIDIAGAMLLWFPVYYVLGFLLFTSILAGIGSTCNTIKETQSLMMPVMLVFILPLMAWPKLVQSPDGTLARVLSFVPPVTPMVMVLRLSASSSISTLEIIASIIVLALGVMATVWAAAKVFRTGILMYGKRPGLREICRWLRHD